MRRIIFFAVLILLVGSIGYVYWNYYNPYEDGTVSGTLQRFSRKGNVFKTYEGELLQNGIKPRAGGVSAQYFYFSVSDEGVASKLDKYQGQDVELHYVRYRRSLPWRGDAYKVQNQSIGQYIVDEVAPVAGGVSPSGNTIQP